MKQQIRLVNISGYSKEQTISTVLELIVNRAERSSFVLFEPSNGSDPIFSTRDENLVLRRKKDSVKVKYERFVHCFEGSILSFRQSAEFIFVASKWRSLLPVLPEFKKAYMLPFQDYVKNTDIIYFLFSDDEEKLFAEYILMVDMLTKELSISDSSMESKYISADVFPAAESASILKFTLYAVEITVSNERISETQSHLIVDSDDKANSISTTSIQSVYFQLKNSIPWLSLWSEQIDEYLLRVIIAIFRDRRKPRRISSNFNITAIISETQEKNTISEGNSAESSENINVGQTVRSIPGLGWTVFEFFSGIGGMRLGLPPMIRGLPIEKICAYDISEVANKVYEHNFLSANCKTNNRKDELRRLAIDGLKIADVDGRSDIWTMSPPCQPFTLTKGAHQRDHKDNRSKAILHLMHLLLEMKRLPRFIVLENVAGFVSSTVLIAWKKVMRRCRYRYRQFLLSPHLSVGIPNSRKRYYFIAEHLDSIEPVVDINLKVASFSTEDEENAVVHESLPSSVASSYPTQPVTIMDCLSSRFGYQIGGTLTAETLLNERLSDKELNELLVSSRILLAPWAPVLLSIVGPFDTASFCFTKGYGKIFDRSAGSLFYPQAKGPLSLAEHRIIDRGIPEAGEAEEDYDEDDSEDGDVNNKSIEGSQENRKVEAEGTEITERRKGIEKLEAVLGCVRLFSPDEMLALSGFPASFEFPPEMPLRHRMSCIGNSVNVRVVQAVMKCLFESHFH